MSIHTDSTARVIKWCFMMVLLGVPFFIYETTSYPYYVTQYFGFDIITVAMSALTFIPFIYFIVRND